MTTTVTTPEAAPIIVVPACAITNTVKWFNDCKPAPTELDAQVQIGVHFEEVKEMLEEIQGEDRETILLLIDAYAAMHALAEHLKNAPTTKIKIKNPEKFMDALEDQIVTAVGSGVFVGFDMVGGLHEVNRSLFSKFVDNKPIFHPNGKMAKGPNFTKPDLHPFL